MKVAQFNNNFNILQDPILGRPFSHNLEKFTFTSNYDEADFIHCNLHYLNCNEEYEYVKNTQIFNRYSHKFVFWTMHDNPWFAYQESKSIKFVCQPLHDYKTNNKFNVIPVPLQMRHYEYELIKDIAYINSVRKNEKINNFTYVGQIIYAEREWLKTIKLPKYDFEETKPIWHIDSVENRVNLTKEFCHRLSKAKFCFAPRGMGTSSFRLYQSLMVGTIPIVFGMVDYPFKEEVSWTDFTIENCDDYENLLLLEKYDNMRKNGILFWEKYVNIPKCDKILFDRYLYAR